MTLILVTNTMLNHIKHSFKLATREIYTKIQMFRILKNPNVQDGKPNINTFGSDSKSIVFEMCHDI